ncbi:MAG TPA: hypothetical protein VFJ46_17600 [Xanthobacteraceae bacterium]|nr:hypothetical protein [Xanthobacteraceae bacterium]
MATAGAKPKPAHLRIIDGTHRADRHGNKAEKTAQVAATADKFGALIKPRSLKGEAAAAWKRYIEPADWLDVSREPAAIAFCELWAQFREAPRSFTAANHAQLRHYLAELGLSDERNRGGAGEGQKRDEFFDD